MPVRNGFRIGNRRVTYTDTSLGRELNVRFNLNNTRATTTNETSGTSGNNVFSSCRQSPINIISPVQFVITPPSGFLDIKYKSGVSKARNFGASQASYEFLAFLDDDDLWPKDYLFVIKNFIEQHDPDCLVTSLSKLKDGKIFDYKNVEGQINKDIILTRNPGITGSSIVVKKTKFFSVGGFDNELITGEDKSLILEFINKNYKIITVSEIKAIHREHQSDIRLSNEENMWRGTYLFYKKYKKQMNTLQRLDNLYKIKRYNWLDNKTFINSFVYLCLLFLIFLKRCLFKFIK